MLKTTDFKYVFYLANITALCLFEENVIVGTTNVDHSPPTFTFPVQKDTLFKTLTTKSEIVYPFKTQGLENYILFRPNKGVPPVLLPW